MILDKVLFLLNSIIIKWECWNYDNLCCSMNDSHWLVFDMCFSYISSVMFFSRSRLVKCIKCNTAYPKSSG